MQFPFRIKGLGDEVVTCWDTQRIESLRNYDKTNFQQIIDEYGQKSARAQRLSGSITDMARLKSGDQRIYLYVVTDDSKTYVMGGLKVGNKQLYLGTSTHEVKKYDTTAVLDFYVHESCQRRGIGHILFENFLKTEDQYAGKISYDRPSSKLLQFLCKHYSLTNGIAQSNNFYVFPDFFQLNTKTNNRISSVNGNWQSISSRPLTSDKARRAAVIEQRNSSRQSRQSTSQNYHHTKYNTTQAGSLANQNRQQRSEVWTAQSPSTKPNQNQQLSSLNENQQSFGDAYHNNATSSQPQSNNSTFKTTNGDAYAGQQEYNNDNYAYGNRTQAPPSRANINQHIDLPTNDQAPYPTQNDYNDQDDPELMSLRQQLRDAESKLQQMQLSSHGQPQQFNDTPAKYTEQAYAVTSNNNTNYGEGHQQYGLYNHTQTGYQPPDKLHGGEHQGQLQHQTYGLPSQPNQTQPDMNIRLSSSKDFVQNINVQNQDHGLSKADHAVSAAHHHRSQLSDPNINYNQHNHTGQPLDHKDYQKYYNDTRISAVGGQTPHYTADLPRFNCVPESDAVHHTIDNKSRSSVVVPTNTKPPFGTHDSLAMNSTRRGQQYGNESYGRDRSMASVDSQGLRTERYDYQRQNRSGNQAKMCTSWQ